MSNSMSRSFVTAFVTVCSDEGVAVQDAAALLQKESARRVCLDRGPAFSEGFAPGHKEVRIDPDSLDKSAMLGSIGSRLGALLRRHPKTTTGLGAFGAGSALSQNLPALPKSPQLAAPPASSHPPVPPAPPAPPLQADPNFDAQYQHYLQRKLFPTFNHPHETTPWQV